MQNHKFIDEKDVQRISYMMCYIFAHGWRSKEVDMGSYSFSDHDEDYYQAATLFVKPGKTHSKHTFDDHYFEYGPRDIEYFSLYDAFYEEGGIWMD